MARIDRRPARRQQRDERRLRPLKMEGNLKVAVGRHFVEVAIPGLAWVDSQLFSRPAGDQIPGALHVAAGERLAVCDLTPSRSLKMSALPSSFHDQFEAKSGTIDARLFCRTC